MRPGAVHVIYSRNGGGSHGHSWEVVEIARRFEGTKEECESNIASHDWHTEFLFTECRVCGFEDYEAETTYSCGTTHFPRVFIMNGQYGNHESQSYELKRTDSKIAFIKRIEFCR